MAGVLKVWNGTAWVSAGPGLNDDTGWVSGWATAPSSQTTATVFTTPPTTAKYRRIGRLVEVRFSGTTDAIYDLSTNTSGNYSNANVWSGLPSAVCPADSMVLPSIRLRDMNIQGWMNPNGTLVITGGPPFPDSFAAGVTCDGSFMFFLG